MRDDLDRFYTKDDVAQECLDSFDTSLYDLRIEPSAGAGAFSSLVESLAYDISPQQDGVIEQDWFTVTPFDLPTFDSLLVFGNPPFGKRSSIAKNFIRHSIRLGADTIAFILPSTFSKKTNQSVFPETWRLIQELELSSSHFELFDHGEIYIPCKFYVWTKRADVDPGVNIREKTYPRPAEFVFVKRGSEEADFTINGNSGKVKRLEDVTNPKAEHYIRITDRTTIDAVRERLAAVEFTFHSSVNGGVAWINQDAIARAWHEKYIGTPV